MNGRLTAHVAYRPLYRPSRSSSYYFDPLEVPAVRDFVERNVRKIDYTGQISFDWIRGEDGRCAVLVCNPRREQRGAPVRVPGSVAGGVHRRSRIVRRVEGSGEGERLAEMASASSCARRGR